MVFSTLLANLLKSLASFTWGNVLMLIVGGLLIAAGASGKRRALFFLPVGFGCILANLGATSQEGAFRLLYEAGLLSGLFPLLVLAGLGTALDLSPLLRQPRTVILAAASQIGIYGPLILATLLGFSLGDAASIGMVGALSWPAAVFVASRLSPGLLPVIAVTAYACLVLAAAVRPLLVESTASPDGDGADPEPAEEHRPLARWVLAAFPVGIAVLAGIFARPAAPLVGALMAGNLLRAAGPDNRYLKIARDELAAAALLLMGLTVGSSMAAGSILSLSALKVMLLALIALLLDLLGGMLVGKFTGRRLSELLPVGDPDSGARSGDARAAVQLGAVLAGGVLLAVVLAAG